MEGNGLSDAERDTIAAKLHQYTGLSVDYIKKANLRVSEGEYTQELLREHRETVGRLDSRFTGVTFDRWPRTPPTTRNPRPSVGPTPRRSSTITTAS
jgi:hypothetical protein